MQADDLKTRRQLTRDFKDPHLFHPRLRRNVSTQGGSSHPSPGPRSRRQCDRPFVRTHPGKLAALFPSIRSYRGCRDHQVEGPITGDPAIASSWATQSRKLSGSAGGPTNRSLGGGLGGSGAAPLREPLRLPLYASFPGRVPRSAEPVRDSGPPQPRSLAAFGMVLRAHSAPQ